MMKSWKRSSRRRRKRQKVKNAEAAEGTEEPKKLKIRKRPELINETQPLWTKHPNECTKEEYLDFYRKDFRITRSLCSGST